VETTLLVLTIACLHLLGVISPGPNFFISVKRGLTSSPRDCFLNALGVGLGMLVHTLIGCLGLSVLVSSFSWIVVLIKYLGAGYLMFLGIQSIFFKNPISNEKKFNRSEDGIQIEPAFRIGFVTAAFNPKVIIYFLALFSTIISPDTPFAIKLIIVILLPAISFFWHLSVANLFSFAKFKKQYQAHYLKVELIFGVLMVALGIKIAITKD
jgi:threonine/homoserine/homoserine lactone efflux protein